MLPNPIWTLQEAIAYFDRQNERGQIPNRKAGGFRTIGAAERRVILNDVRNALARAGREAGMSGTDPAALPLTPFLEVLEHFARVDAQEEGRSRPANRAASVRLFLAVLEGHEPRTRRRAIAESFLPAWVPLYEAVAGLEITNPNARQPRHRRYPGYLYQFQNFVLRHGVDRPEALPSYDQLRVWAEAERARKSLDNWLSAYRKGREAMGNPTFLPSLAPSPIGLHRGLRGLDLSALLSRVGCITPQEDMSVEELVRVLAPQIARAVDYYVEHAGKSTSWNETVINGASCLVAELVRMGMADELPELDLLDLFERRVAVEVVASRKGAIPILRRRLGTPAGPSTVSLLRRYVDEASRRSFQHSPMQPTTVVPDGEVPIYTTALFNETSALWQVAEFVYGRAEGFPEPGMMEAKAEEWARIRLEYQLVRQHMKDTNVVRQAEGFKDKHLISITWAQAICVALPQLWRRAYALREAYHMACTKHEDVESRPVRAARARYFKALGRYVLTAVLLEDGLRVANYAGGRVGRNFLPEVERAEDGTWERIVGVRTFFRGYCDEAPLKVRRSEQGKERRRERSLRPGIVDMELLTDFWLELRPRALVSCGLIPSLEAYDPNQDTFALFVSPCSTREEHGGYTPARLSKNFGKVLHWMMREVFGRDVPTWKQLAADKTLRHKWRGLFGAHATRLLIATYWGVVRERWSIARELTNDKIVTLQSFYGVFEGWVAEARARQGIENPDHFNDLVDRLRGGAIIDWGTFDPERPEEARVLERMSRDAA